MITYWYPAREYYLGLQSQDREKLVRLVRHLANGPIGTILTKSMYRIEDRENKIYALKPGDERFFNFMTEGRKIVITNAYHKHSQQMTVLDLEKLDKAARYRRDYLRRVSAGSYYEIHD